MVSNTLSTEQQQNACLFDYCVIGQTNKVIISQVVLFICDTKIDVPTFYSVPSLAQSSSVKYLTGSTTSTFWSFASIVVHPTLALTLTFPVAQLHNVCFGIRECFTAS